MLNTMGNLLAVYLFIIGLKKLNSPRTAMQGNYYSAAGMLIALVIALTTQPLKNIPEIYFAILIGCCLGWFISQKTKMTQMPQMVALLNGFGGLASFIIVLVDYSLNTQTFSLSTHLSSQLGLVIGGVTFTGSMIAFAKLQELIKGRFGILPMHNAINLFCTLIILGLMIYMPFGNMANEILFAIAILSLVWGILLTTPVGGADMPVVISLLNSYSGLAVCATGFLIGNVLMIITGALVGASGIILTQVMCKAMNRSFINVLFGAASAKTIQTTETQKNILGHSAEEIAMLLENAKEVIIVPGYGLAVAQGQHLCKELCDLLEKKGASVKYAIHPIAGRMPGHMNVILAEANVPYEQLYEMDAINPEFNTCDVALVLGANDVTNPAAKDSPGSPIYGMPILDVLNAKNIVVIKRSLATGFANLPNKLFEMPNTLMFFADLKKALQEMTLELKKV